METQYTIAKKVGMSQANLNRLLNGKGNAGFDVAGRLADFFETNLLIWIDPARVDDRVKAYARKIESDG